MLKKFDYDKEWLMFVLRGMPAFSLNGIKNSIHCTVLWFFALVLGNTRTWHVGSYDILSSVIDIVYHCYCNLQLDFWQVYPWC